MKQHHSEKISFKWIGLWIFGFLGIFSIIAKIINLPDDWYLQGVLLSIPKIKLIPAFIFTLILNNMLVNFILGSGKRTGLFHPAHSELQRGIDLCKNNKAKDAIPIFKKIISRYPDWGSPYINLANVYLEFYRYDKAKYYLNEAKTRIDNLQDSAILNHEYGVMYFQQGLYQKAIKYFNHPDVKSMYNNDYDRLINLSYCYYITGYIKTAFDYYEGAALNFKKYQPYIQNNNHPMAEYYTNKYYKLLQYEAELQENSYKDQDVSRLITIKNSDIQEHDSKNDLHYNRTCYPFKNEIDDVLSFFKKYESGNSLKRKCFFIGAGVSFAAPSSIPFASKILSDMISFLLGLESEEILKNILTKKGGKNLYERFAKELFNDEMFPFEETFQTLENVLGSNIRSFVELLRYGKPNINHYMLATQLKNGNTVITPNFDTKIEEAYIELYGEKSLESDLEILVSDADYYRYVNNSIEKNNNNKPVLAKIHGSIENYNSLAISTQGISSSADQSLSIEEISDNFKDKFEENQLKNSLLSIPKDIFLQNSFDNDVVMFMGYSASDKADIVPLINYYTNKTPIIWISHERKDAPENWDMKKYFKYIQPPTKEEYYKLNSNEKITEYEPYKSDITSAISSSLIQNYHPDVINRISDHMSASVPWHKVEKLNEFPIEENFSLSIYNWLASIGIRKGDGLFFLAQYFDKKGYHLKALDLLIQADMHYRNSNAVNTKRQIRIANSILEIYVNTGQLKKAKEHAMQMANNFINNQLVDLYPNEYGYLKIKMAKIYLEFGDFNFAGNCFSEAKVINERLKSDLLSAKIEQTMGIYFEKKENYEEAVNHYSLAFQISSNSVGDAYSAITSCCGVARCLIRLGSKYEAHNYLVIVEPFLNFVEDQDMSSMVDTVRYEFDLTFTYNHKIITKRNQINELIKELIKNENIEFSYLMYRIEKGLLDEDLLKLLNKLRQSSSDTNNIEVIDYMLSLYYSARELYDEAVSSLKPYSKDPLFKYHLIIAEENLKIQKLECEVNSLRCKIEELKKEDKDKNRDKINSLDTEKETKINQVDELKQNFNKNINSKILSEGNISANREVLEEQRDYHIKNVTEKLEESDWSLEELETHLNNKSSKHFFSILNDVKEHDASFSWYKSMLYKRLGKYEKEEEFLRDAIQSTDKNTLFHCNLGVNLLCQKKYKDAEESLKRAIDSLQADGGYPLALSYLVEVYAIQGKKREAKKQFENAKAIGATQYSISSLTRLFPELK